MKRRFSEAIPKDRSPIRTLPPQRSLHGVGRSDSQFRNPTPQRPKDISHNKRIKFKLLDVDNPLSCKLHASSTLLEGSRAPRSHGPKTSEFAFFRKVKENASHKFHSDTLQKEDNQSKKFKISDCSGERTNSITNRRKDIRSSLHTENIAPISFSSFLSPLGGASKKSEVNPREDCTSSRGIYSIWENMEQYSDALSPRGAQHRHGEIFSRKRQKLRQWVVEISHPNIEELCSKGYDFVSMLLSRLFPENNENSGFRNLKSGELDIDTKSQLLASLESDVQIKKLNHIPARNYMELDYGSHLGDGPSSRWLNKSQEAVLSNCYSPTSDAKIACLKYEIREPGYELGGRAPVLCADNDSAYGFPSKRYGSLAYNRLKELGELDDPNEYLIQREPCTLLIGWDFDRGTDERNLSVSCHGTDLSVHSPSSSSWGDDPQHILDDRLGLNGLTKSSFLSICSPKVISLPWSQSASYSDHDFGRRVIEDKESICADFNHFPLTLSFAPDYLNLAEDCENDTKCKDSSIFFLPQNLHHIMSKVLGERYHHPGKEGFLLSSGLDIDLEWNFPSLTGSSRKHHSPFNYALQTPQKDGTSSGFLLNDMIDYESCLDGLSHRRN